MDQPAVREAGAAVHHDGHEAGDRQENDDDDDVVEFTLADKNAREAFVKLTNRGTYLRLSDRGITKIPPRRILRRRAQLKSLLLHRNRLTVVDGLEELKQLETLSLAQNRLRKFPHQVLDLERLTYLNLSNNQLKFVPASIKHLTNLEVLWLNHTGIAAFPEEMSCLQKLETLGARHNAIKALPHEFCEMKALRWLTLADNRLSSLPKCFRILDNLRHLNLSGNRFQSLPPAVGDMKNLKYCFFSRNWIRLPCYVVILRLAAMNRIKMLDLRMNPIVAAIPLRRVSNVFPFVHLSSSWFDWADDGSTWQDSLETASLDDSFSSESNVVIANAEPIRIPTDYLIKTVMPFLL